MKILVTGGAGFIGFYLYVDDAIEVCLKPLKWRSQTSEISAFNVGIGIETSINKLYHLISKMIRKK